MLAAIDPEAKVIGLRKDIPIIVSGTFAALIVVCHPSASTVIVQSYLWSDIVIHLNSGMICTVRHYSFGKEALTLLQCFGSVFILYGSGSSILG